VARNEWMNALEVDPAGAHENPRALDEAREHVAAGRTVYEKLRFEAAQLDLIAGRRLRRVAAELLRQHGIL
jgi:hypothetical protein